MDHRVKPGDDVRTGGSGADLNASSEGALTTFVIAVLWSGSPAHFLIAETSKKPFRQKMRQSRAEEGQ
jgi:hypothetical protein